MPKNANKKPISGKSSVRSKGLFNHLYFSFIGLLLLVAGVLLYIAQTSQEPVIKLPVVAEKPVEKPTTQAAPSFFVDEQQCIGCHHVQGKDWQGSHHQLAMQTATGQSVLGNFNNTTFKGEKDTTRFFRKDDDFWVNTVDGDGKTKDFKVAYAFGVAPLQQYLLETDGGRLQALGVAWNTERNR